MSTTKLEKKSKKVLMLCYYFPPFRRVGSLRSAKFAKYLGKYGWKCEIVTAYKGLSKEYDSNNQVKIHPTLRFDLNEILSILVSCVHYCLNFIRKILRTFKLKIKSGSNISLTDDFETKGGLGIADRISQWLQLPDGQVLWIILALPKVLWLARKCDVIYSSSSPFSAHVLGMITKKLTGKYWVADYRDAWTLNREWNPITTVHRWLGEKLDVACVQNADSIINVSEIATKKFIEHFLCPPQKFVTIYNGYDEQDIAKYRGLPVSCDPLVMTSIGSLYGGRDPKPLFKAINRGINKKIIERKQLRINLIGAQSRDPQLSIELKISGISDIVKITPRIPQEQAFMELAKSHLALLIGSDMERLAMTTKVYEYAGMGKPIVALVPHGSVYNFVKQYGGWCVTPDNEEEILQVLKTIFDLYKQSSLQEFKSPEFVKKYERCTLTKQLAECFNSFIN